MIALQAGIGLICIFGSVYICSKTRRNIDWSLVFRAFTLQLLLMIALFSIPGAREFFCSLNRVILILEDVTTRSSQFLFGYLAGAPAPFPVIRPEAQFMVAMRVFPLVIVISALSSVLFYIGLLPLIISKFARFLTKTLRISGPLGFGNAACIFLGTIEAPLSVKNYIPRMGGSELSSLITCSMSTIAGTVMVLYAGILKDVSDSPLVHLMTASLLSIPWSLMLSEIYMPGLRGSGEVPKYQDKHAEGIIDALLKGAAEGMNMVLNITATLLVTFALIYLINDLIALLPWGDTEPLTIQKIFGYLMRPVAWLTGIPWEECPKAGEILATKILMNEFVAYTDLSQDHSLSPSSKMILLYSCCGFGNLGSVGIIIGGLGALAPSRKQEIIRYTLSALVLSNLVTLSTGAVIAIVNQLSTPIR